MLTLENARTLLELYRRMALAAEAGEWDELAELVRQSGALRMAAAPALQPPSPDQAAEIEIVIKQILELDHGIRLHAEPALESTRKLLSSSVKGRAVRNAYGG